MEKLPIQYSGLDNSMDCIVHGVAKSQTWLNDFHNMWFSLCIFEVYTREIILPLHYYVWLLSFSIMFVNYIAVYFFNMQTYHKVIYLIQSRSQQTCSMIFYLSWDIPFLCVSQMVAFGIQQKNCLGVAKNLWPTKPKIYTFKTLKTSLSSTILMYWEKVELFSVL